VARFDEVFADLQAKMNAAMGVISQYPDVALEVRQAIEVAKTAAQIAEDAAQDDARANALNTVILGVRQTLAEVAPLPADAELKPADTEPTDPVDPPTEDSSADTQDK